MNKHIIYRGNSVISVEALPEYSQQVVIKRPSESHPSPRIVQSLEKEYVMTRFLIGVEGVRKALEQRSRENHPVLILEYVDGETLKDHSARKKLDLRSRLKIAVEITRILGEIHKHNTVHLNLNSENILIGKKQRAVRFIDLGAATHLDGTVHLKVRPDQMLGNLSYISPEQTGRINRALDERSDLYSLGVTLYELMTGELPFDSEDPTELIHHHISRMPAPPSEVSRDIPEIISAIIMKLLRKSADDRYQSATGARADLEACLQRLKPDNTIEEFTPGESDHTSRFIYPQELYGRGSESKELVGALGSAFRQTSSLILVSGHSGIGKTALVEELQRPVSERHGYFVRGKFDQYLRATPYSGFAQAFATFVSQILTEPESRFRELQESVQSAVGDLGRVLIDVIPDVEELIGPQPDVLQLGGQESENRFNYVFINFLSAAATEEHPLALFIDDLQWIDAASLRLIKLIQSDFHQRPDDSLWRT